MCGPMRSPPCSRSHCIHSQFIPERRDPDGIKLEDLLPMIEKPFGESVAAHLPADDGDTLRGEKPDGERAQNK
jgi:hypothetical protein